MENLPLVGASVNKRGKMEAEKGKHVFLKNGISQRGEGEKTREADTEWLFCDGEKSNCTLSKFTWCSFVSPSQGLTLNGKWKTSG